MIWRNCMAKLQPILWNLGFGVIALLVISGLAVGIIEGLHAAYLKGLPLELPTDREPTGRERSQAMSTYLSRYRAVKQRADIGLAIGVGAMVLGLGYVL